MALAAGLDLSSPKFCFLPRRIIPRFHSAAFSLPCFRFFLTRVFRGFQKFLRAALMFDFTRGFRPSATWRGGHLKGFLHGSGSVMSFTVLNLTRNLGRDCGLGFSVTLTPGKISSGAEGLRCCPCWSPTFCPANLFRGLSLSPELKGFARLPPFALCANSSAFTLGRGPGRDPKRFRSRCSRGLCSLVGAGA